MHAGKSYKLSEFLFWTRRSIYVLIILGIVPVFLYHFAGLKWLNIPWPVVALLGTATAFIVGFKNTQTYNRTEEAQQIWTTILNLSRAWGLVSRDYFDNPAKTKDLIYGHLAWLTALRYQMREHRIWESTAKKHNAEYSRFYSIPEKEMPLKKELAKYLSTEDLTYILKTGNKATHIMGLQSRTLKELYRNEQIVLLQFVEMERGIKEFFVQQGKAEQIKDSPYPRQYAIINTLFVRLFCLLLPFGMLKEFEKLDELVDGVMKGQMVWLVVPFSIMISWMYTSLEQVGESTENPFEGGANDVPISQMCRNMEIELREFLGETELPLPLQAQNNIIL
ncbi:bestrophin family protein [Dyadobacter sp. NIV53]|uniref:bestrophin family protein n=1 Tax=Dyadobacter sp. NIV53 TaxID=2861765 RepID=UPI001C870DCC|nr:bestrophin family ion channel [Dyadobacter sp. NIV53]